MISLMILSVFVCSEFYQYIERQKTDAIVFRDAVKRANELDTVLVIYSDKNRQERNIFENSYFNE